MVTYIHSSYLSGDCSCYPLGLYLFQDCTVTFPINDFIKNSGTQQSATLPVTYAETYTGEFVFSFKDRSSISVGFLFVVIAEVRHFVWCQLPLWHGRTCRRLFVP